MHCLYLAESTGGTSGHGFDSDYDVSLSSLRVVVEVHFSRLRVKLERAFEMGDALLTSPENPKCRSKVAPFAKPERRHTKTYSFVLLTLLNAFDEIGFCG